MNVQEIRQKYPQYNDMSDEDLGRALHAKFYSDMPYAEFADKTGFPGERPPVSGGTQDKFDAMARGRARPTPIKASDEEKRRVLERTDPTARFIERGAGDLAYGVAQLGAWALSPISDAPLNAVNRSLAERNQQYDRDRRLRQQIMVDAAGGSTNPADYNPGADIAGTVGSVASSMTAAPARAGAAAVRQAPATWYGRAGQAALAGGAGAALQPVDEIAPDSSFAWEKGKQAALGATVGAVAAPVTEGIVRGGVALMRGIKRVRGGAFTDAQIENLASQAAGQSGIEWKALPEEVRQNIIRDMRGASDLTNLDPKAVGRAIDIRAVGAQPTRGSVTLDPRQITREKNLAKLGAASDDPAFRTLTELESTNNTALINRANELGANRGPDAFATGEAIIGSLKGADAARKKVVDGLYADARRIGGGDVPLDTNGAISVMFKTLDDAGKLASLPNNVAQSLNKIQSGEAQLTVGRAESLKTTIAEEIRKAKAARDGNAVAALSDAYKVIDGAEPTAAVGADAVKAYRAARNANRALMTTREESAALSAAIDGADPDRFVQKYIIGGGASVADIQAMNKSLDPQAREAVRGHIVAYLKGRALNGKSDEIGTFSYSNFDRALADIGDRKLAAFFTQDEIAQLKQLGRAASYLTVQPKGSAVNNSNTAAEVVGRGLSALGRVGEMSQIPFAGEAGRAGQNALARGQVRREAQNALRNPLGMSNDDYLRMLGFNVPGAAALGGLTAQ